MPASHGAEAAALLAQALSGPCAATWRPHLGSLRSLTDRFGRHKPGAAAPTLLGFRHAALGCQNTSQRVNRAGVRILLGLLALSRCRLFDVCARNGVGTARPPRRPSRQYSDASLPMSPLSNASSSPFGAQPDLDHNRGTDLDSSFAQAGPASAASQQQQESPSCREAAGGVCQNALFHVSRVHIVAPWAGTTVLAVAAALLPALALFDLPGFLLLLSRRLAPGGAEPSSPTHVMSFLALLRLAHSPQVIVVQLPSCCTPHTV